MRAIKSGLLGGLSAAPTVEARDSKLDAYSSAREHVHKGVNAEQIDLATNQIAYARLGYTKEVCRSTLGQFARPDEAPDFYHQFRAKPQALGFPCSEAKVSEHIPGRALNFYRHSSFLRRLWSSSLNRDFASSESYPAVFLLFLSKAWIT
ncbi:hypothetical protein [Candidatus Binatus sp.]|uniref:hypothetical protein n=1 Tax=Candidatus Binatus sp. TaxID=2811406 RepID=UPI003BB0FC24